jgi:hypothetical protein
MVQQPHNELAMTPPAWWKHPRRTTGTGGHAASWETVARRLAVHEGPAELAAYQFVFASPLITSAPRHHGLCAAILPAGNARAEGALDLMRRIFTEFTYDKSATTVDTDRGPGADQPQRRVPGFAHVAISCLRALGLAARYVSGYLETKPPPGKAKLVGADASHAWISLFVPDTGWVDLDPTNNHDCR